jgi:hypothetical protein
MKGNSTSIRTWDPVRRAYENAQVEAMAIVKPLIKSIPGAMTTSNFLAIT